MIPRILEIGKRVLTKKGLPAHIVLFITNKCNMECEHCFLVEGGELNDISRQQVLTLDNIKKIANSNPKILALSLTGGEPFLRNDLPQIIQAFTRSGYLKGISLVSNGYLTKKILDCIKKILKETDVDIFLSISLDGENETHNKIRKKPDAYSKAIDTIKALSKLSKRDKRLSIGVNSTYTGSNYFSIRQLYEELTSVKLDYITLNLIRGVTWESRPEGIDLDEYNHLSSLKEKLIPLKKEESSFLYSLMTSKGRLMSKMISDTVKQSRSVNNCYAGSLFGVIKDNGDVFACEQLSAPLGNLSEVDYDLSKIWFSDTAEEQRRSIRNHECFCTYECVSSCNIFFNPKYYPALLMEAFISKNKL